MNKEHFQVLIKPQPLKSRYTVARLYKSVKPGMRLYFLLFLAVSAAGCVKQAPDPAQLRADEVTLVQSTVTDPARAERLLALLGERDRLVDETAALMRQYRREMGALNADYDASRDVVVEIIDYYNRERARKQLRFIDLVTQMKRATTAVEWSIIADFELEYFNPRQLIYRPLAGGA